MKKVILGVAAAFVLASTAGCGAIQKDETASGCKVNDKDRVYVHKQGSEKRIYTTCGTFTVNDSLTRGKFNSADLYGNIQRGHTYTLTYNGWRNGFLSMFPNVTKAVEE